MSAAPANTHDGSDSPPALRLCLNLFTLEDLPDWSSGPAGQELDAQLAAVKAAGFASVQFPEGGDAKLCEKHGLLSTGSGRVNEPDEADEVARQLIDLGHTCGTLHVGWGMESDDKLAALTEAVLTASERHRFPLYIETHRATMTQDMWRTVKLCERFPEVRFNGDFSHWYTGQEMVYGGFEHKMRFIEPVLQRVRFIHGRISNPGCIQVNIDDGDAQRHPYVDHYRRLWTACFAGFLEDASPGDFVCFTPELLAPCRYYARTFPAASGEMREECDRWEQALLYNRIAAQCFEQAQQAAAAS